MLRRILHESHYLARRQGARPSRLFVPFVPMSLSRAPRASFAHLSGRWATCHLQARRQACTARVKHSETLPSRASLMSLWSLRSLKAPAPAQPLSVSAARHAAKQAPRPTAHGPANAPPRDSAEPYKGDQITAGVKQRATPGDSGTPLGVLFLRNHFQNNWSKAPRGCGPATAFMGVWGRCEPPQI